MTTAASDRNFSTGTITRWRIGLWALAGLLLAAPWVAMRFSTAVAWDALDFLVFGALLGLAGGLVEIAVRISRSRRFVIAAVLVVGACFLAIWAELAVGIIGGS